MKTKFFILFSVLIGMTSCSSLQTYYQVCDVKSTLPITSDGHYQYKDADCTVTYDFWCDGGNPGFVFTNNSDEIIYVDLSKSFFIKNGIAYDYFLNRSVSSSSSSTASSSLSKSASIYGYWYDFLNLIPGSVSASGSVGSSSSKSSTIKYTESAILAIPPHASKSVSEYIIGSSYIYECGFNIVPTKKETPSYNYDADTSPLKFGNYITYRKGNEATEQYVSNNFYVNVISYLHSQSALITESTGCQYNPHDVTHVKGVSPQKFYVKYTIDPWVAPEVPQMKRKKEKENKQDW